jgi:hypothetical protein
MTPPVKPSIAVLLEYFQFPEIPVQVGVNDETNLLPEMLADGSVGILTGKAVSQIGQPAVFGIGNFRGQEAVEDFMPDQIPRVPRALEVTPLKGSGLFQKDVVLNNQGACGRKGLRPRLDEPQGAADTDNTFYLAIGEPGAFLNVFPVNPFLGRARRKKVQNARQLIAFEQIAVADLKLAV